MSDASIANCCAHPDTYLLEEPWPTGEDIEVCKLCGMSRAHWEQGESPWTLIDIDDTRRELEKALAIPPEPTRTCEGDPYHVNKLAYHSAVIRNLRAGDNRTLLQVHLMPQNACNQSCNFCSYRMPHNKNSALFDESKTLPIEAIAPLIEDFKALGVRAVEVTGGGEPLAHPNKYEMFEMLFAAGFDVGLVTNGTLVTDRLAELLAPNLTWMRVSIDAANRETYIKLRRSARVHFDCATDAIRKIRRYGNHKPDFRLGAGFVMSNGNELEVYGFCELVKALGADNARLSLTFSDYDMAYFKDQKKLKAGVALAKRAEEELSDGAFRVFNLIPERHDNLVEAANDYPKCYTKDVLCVIEGKGDVYTCCTFTGTNKGRHGNILTDKDGFAGVWRRSQAFRLALDPRRYCNVTCLYKKRNLEMINLVHQDLIEIANRERPAHVNFI